MSICSMLCSSALMRTRWLCVNVARRRASVRHNEGPHGRDTLPDQNASESSRRDGSFGSGVQSNKGHEHRRDQAADRCDRGLRTACLLPSGPDTLRHRFYTTKTHYRHATSSWTITQRRGLLVQDARGYGDTNSFCCPLIYDRRARSWRGPWMGASPVAVVIIMDGAEAVGITMAGGTIIIIGKLDSMIQAAQ
ncbi:hypothetical protein ABIE79_003597 [Bradyrhizobium diazoefficiens]